MSNPLAIASNEAAAAIAVETMDAMIEAGAGPIMRDPLFSGDPSWARALANEVLQCALAARLSESIPPLSPAPPQQPNGA